MVFVFWKTQTLKLTHILNVQNVMALISGGGMRYIIVMMNTIGAVIGMAPPRNVLSIHTAKEH